jgi:hypothetical protein
MYITEVQNILGFFFQGKSFKLIFTKNGLGEFFETSSGHPGGEG